MAKLSGAEPWNLYYECQIQISLIIVGEIMKVYDNNFDMIILTIMTNANYAAVCNSCIDSQQTNHKEA